MESDYTRITSEISKNKILQKYQAVWRLSKTLLRNSQSNRNLKGLEYILSEWQWKHNISELAKCSDNSSYRKIG